MQWLIVGIFSIVPLRASALPQEEKAAITKLRSSGEPSQAAQRAWEDLQQEMVRAATRSSTLRYEE